MTDKEFEKIIRNKFNKIDSVPNSVTDTILNAIQKNGNTKRKFTNIKKIISSAVASLILTPCLVFACSHFTNIFKLSNKGYSDRSLQSAITNNYIQQNNQNNSINANDVTYKFTNVLLNDITMLISLDFEFEQNIEEFEGISFKNLKIFDENNNQIYIDSEDYDIWSKNMATSIDYITSDKSEKHIQETLLLTSPKFNMIKSLNISFDSIILYIVENGTPNTKEIKASDSVEIVLDNTFNNRNTIDYVISQEKISNKNNNLKEIIYTNTGLGVRFIADSNMNAYNYKFNISDIKGKELYSSTNTITKLNNSTEYFIWIDVDSSLSQLENFKFYIVDDDYKINSYVISK